MEPALRAGDFVLVDERAYRNGVPAPGDVVLAQHPDQETLVIVKRVHRVLEEGGDSYRCELRGDNRGATTDLSSLSATHIRGRVVLHMGPRAGSAR